MVNRCRDSDGQEVDDGWIMEKGIRWDGKVAKACTAAAFWVHRSENGGYI